jgi:hypothetical protein
MSSLRLGLFIVDLLRGGKFISKAASKFCDEHLICQELVAPYNPKQNDVAFGKNWTVMELVRSMIHSQTVLSKFWDKATQIAVYVLNRIFSRILN